MAEAATIDIGYNPAYAEFFQDTRRYKFLYGGAGSGKSYSAAQKVIQRIINEPGHNWLCARKVARTMRHSVFELLKETIHTFKRRSLFDIKEGEMHLTYRPNGNRIQLAGLDDPEKLKSIQGITGIWLEEATEATPDDYDQLDLRLRGYTPNYKEYIASFNPININHWLRTRIEAANPKDTLVLRTTFTDNHFIDPEYKAVLLQKAEVNPNYGRVYKDGEWGLPEAERPWMYAFDYTKHIAAEIEVFHHLPLYLSFDFNINPMTCTVHQIAPFQFYHTLAEFRQTNTGVGQFVDQIKNSWVGQHHLIITGDASGRSRTATSGNINNYTIIQNKLRLTPGQIRVPGRNPQHGESRTLSNHILALHPNRLIHKSCKYLIDDLANVEGDDKDHPKAPDTMMGHLLDTVRYCDWAFLPKFVKQAKAS